MRRLLTPVFALVTVTMSQSPAVAAGLPPDAKPIGQIHGVTTVARADGWPPCAAGITLSNPSDSVVATRTVLFRSLRGDFLSPAILHQGSVPGYAFLANGEVWPVSVNLASKELMVEDGLKPDSADGVFEAIVRANSTDIVLDGRYVSGYTAFEAWPNDATAFGFRVSAGYQRSRWLPSGVSTRQRSPRPFQVDVAGLDVRSSEDHWHRTGASVGASLELLHSDVGTPAARERTGLELNRSDAGTFASRNRTGFAPNRSLSVAASWLTIGPVRDYRAGLEGHYDVSSRIGFDASAKWASAHVDDYGRTEKLVGVLGADLSPCPAMTVNVQEIWGEPLTSDAVFGASIGWYPRPNKLTSWRIGWVQPSIWMLSVRLGSEK